MSLIQLSGTEASWAQTDAEDPILGKNRRRREQAIIWESCPPPQKKSDRYHILSCQATVCSWIWDLEDTVQSQEESFLWALWRTEEELWSFLAAADSPALGQGQDPVALLIGTGTAVLRSWDNLPTTKSRTITLLFCTAAESFFTCVLCASQE